MISKCVCVLAVCLALAASPVLADKMAQEWNMTAPNDTVTPAMPPARVPRPDPQLTPSSEMVIEADDTPLASIQSSGGSRPRAVGLGSTAARETAVVKEASLNQTSGDARQYCPTTSWYSSKYNKCFNRYGKCWQYDYTDSSTCKNGKDYIKCQWDPFTKLCDAVCEPNEWYSPYYGKCYDKYGSCWQYDYTDSSTCKNGKDDLNCQWDPSTKLCDAVCEPNEWYSPYYGKCYDKYGSCWQYDYTDSSTCSTSNDFIKCQWSLSTQLCDPKCTSGEWYSPYYGKCYDKSGSCTQYDGTDVSTCMTSNDFINCQWSPSKEWCDPL